MLRPPIQPMLLTNIEEPFNSEDFLFEIKWDGYRVITFINNDKIYLQSRNKKNLTPYFPELANISSYLKTKKLILDGEICYLNQEGKPIFEPLQGRIGKKNTSKTNFPVTLVVWDLLSYKGKDIYKLPLIERKKYLNETVCEGENLKLSKYIKKEGTKLYQRAEIEGLEGIVAKKIDSPYEFRRSKYWYKIKIWKYTDALIGGYDYNRNSLLVGKKDQNGLTYMGKIKLSLNNNEQEALLKFLPEIKIKNCPFNITLKENKMIWIKPVIKCKVRYTELTNHGTFRHGFAIKLLI